MKIEVVLGFDMETDVGSWTPYYEGLQHGTPLLMNSLAKHNVKSTCFFTADAAQKHSDVLRDVDSAGHEIACHSLYHETVGQPLFPIPGVYPLLDHEVKPRIQLATQIVQDISGKKMKSFRCPRLFGSTDVVNALEELGYVADASYPMYFYKDRLLPYHPAAEDWTQEGQLNIVEIPNFADMAMDSQDEFGRDRDQWPLFRTQSADALMTHINSFVNFIADKHDCVCLCFYFHPWEFWPMPEGLIHYGEGAVQPDPFIVKNCGPYALKQLNRLIENLISLNAEFITAEQLAQRY